MRSIWPSINVHLCAFWAALGAIQRVHFNQTAWVNPLIHWVILEFTKLINSSAVAFLWKLKISLNSFICWKVEGFQLSIYIQKWTTKIFFCILFEIIIIIDIFFGNFWKDLIFTRQGGEMLFPVPGENMSTKQCPYPFRSRNLQITKLKQ